MRRDELSETLPNAASDVSCVRLDSPAELLLSYSFAAPGRPPPSEISARELVLVRCKPVFFIHMDGRHTVTHTSCGHHLPMLRPVKGS